MDNKMKKNVHILSNTADTTSELSYLNVTDIAVKQNVFNELEARTPSAASGLPPPPPPFPGFPPLPSIPGPFTNNLLFPQENIPNPSKKLKPFYWTKIPQHKIMNKPNIWTLMVKDCHYKCIDVINFKDIEELFCVQTTSKISKDVVDGVKSVGKKETGTKYKIQLLDAQRSLTINIFLSQFKGYSSDDIVQLIRTGNHKVMNLEKLQNLVKFFQNEEELTLLSNFDGDRQRLASAEKFMISLLDLSNYKLRIESMIFKDEFALKVSSLDPSLDAAIKAGNDLISSKTLPEILSIIIVIGNFLNYNGYAGNTAGIELSSLDKLTDVKANQTGMHLLHLIAMEAVRINPKLLNLCNELSFLENVAKVNIEEIEKDIKHLESVLDVIKNQTYKSTTEHDIRQQMGEFLVNATDKIDHLSKKLQVLKSLCKKMADFFCQDVASFKLEECFQIFLKFSEQFKQAIKDNEEHQQLERQAIIRLKVKDQELAEKASYAKRLRLSNDFSNNIHSKLRKNEVKTRYFNRGFRKNEDELMAFLLTSREKGITRKSRSVKRPDLLELNYGPVRERCLSSLMETSHEISLANTENILGTQTIEEIRKTNTVQKSWKRLLQSYKESQFREKADITTKRKSFQIFQHNSTSVDSKSFDLKSPSSVINNKRPIPTIGATFSFSENVLQAALPNMKNKLKENINKSSSRETLQNTFEIPTSSEPQSSIIIKGSKVTLKTMATIAKLGRRYSSINENDLKETIRNLRSPNLETTHFSLRSERELASRNSISIRPNTLEADHFNEDQTKELNENVKANQIDLPNAIYSKCKTRKEQDILKFQSNSLYTINNTRNNYGKCKVDCKNVPKEPEKSRCEPKNEQDILEHQSRNSNTLSKNNNIKDEADNNIFNKEFEKSNRQNLSKILVTPIELENREQNRTTPSSNFSQRLVYKIQSNLRTLSLFHRSEDNRNLTSNFKRDINNSSIDIYKTTQAEYMLSLRPEINLPSIKVENEESEIQSPQNCTKKTFCKSLINRLHIKLRVLSPFK